MLFLHDHGLRIGDENLLLLVVFSVIYWLLSVSTGCFNTSLTPVSSTYFAVCTQSTVGFGEIHPVSWFAQCLVSVHILVTVYINLIRPIHDGALDGILKKKKPRGDGPRTA